MSLKKYMEKNKHIIYVTGITASGKTTVGRLLAKRYGYEFLEADKFYDWYGIYSNTQRYDLLTDPKYRDWKLRKKKFPNTEDMDKWKSHFWSFMLNKDRKGYVIEGATLGSRFERTHIEQGNNVESYMLHIDLPYEKWLKQHIQKHGGGATQHRYEELKRIYEVDKPDWYYHITDLEQIKEPLIYQRKGFTDKKWRDLNVNVSGKRVLDIGCNAGWFGDYAVKEGASSYLGIDTAWKEYEEARNNHKGKFLLWRAEDIDKLQQDFDIIICASTLHYIKGKEGFIKKCSEKASKLILEVPVEDDRENARLVKYSPKHSYYKPTIKWVLGNLGKYYKYVEEMGKSTPPDGSLRLVFHATN